MSIAVVLLAHDKPRLLRRLVGALDGIPVLLHIDARVPDDQHAELVRDLPGRVRPVPRFASDWATYQLVEAELAGYREALEHTDAEHIVMMTGADYPLVSAERLVARLAGLRGASWVDVWRLPVKFWGPMGGYDRFVFRNRVRDRKRVWSLWPRRWPRGLRPAGGSQLKILARRHVEQLLELVDTRTDLVEYFRTVWIPDEVMLPSLLVSPAFGFDWESSHVRGQHAWHIDWGEQPSPHPRVLGLDDLPALRDARSRAASPALFARKFTEDSWPVLDRIEQDLWPLP
ncbi:MAG: beta-1,6-N-acetylglucosaminyltransferase [Propionibacteriaceae bacterium]|nr:beta-1,6-N-acetylglucosaminyltransferase [Propionibacteriaceae bacterium]